MDSLRAYVLLLHAKTARDGFPEQYRKGGPMTPAEIRKLTEHANRAKSLMHTSSEVGAKAGPVLDSYEQTLEQFAANIDRVKSEDSALKSAMAEMGNAGAAMEDAFRTDPPKDTQPSEVAHLPKAGAA